MTGEPGATITRTQEAARPHHDWHSREYVREWVEDAPEIQAVWHHARVEQLRRRQEETGAIPTFEATGVEVRQQRHPLRDAGSQAPQAALHGGDHQPGAGQPTAASSGGLTRSLLDHLRWLQQAGFDAVECFWRQDNRALVGGYVAN